MSNKANELFSNWYEAADPNPAASILPLRIDAINKLLKERKTEFWLDLVRIYLDLPPRDSNTLIKLNEKFVASDSNFSTENNANLIRCLASAILCFKLEGANNKFSNLTSLATLNANFLGQYQTYDKIPAISYALSFYNTHSISTRELSYVDFEERLDALTKSVKGATAETNTTTINEAVLSIIEELKKLSQANKSLAEESNVLWWLFSEYSSTSDNFFKNLNNSHLALIAAKELSGLTTFDNGFAAVEQILSKALNISQNVENISLFDAVSSIPEQLKKDIITELDSELNEMTPCLLAIKTSLEFKEGENWSNVYKNYCNNGDVNNSFTTLEISMQFYREFLYLNLI